MSNEDLRSIVDEIRSGTRLGPRSHPKKLTEERLEQILADPHEELSPQQRRNLENRLENAKAERERHEQQNARPIEDVVAGIRRGF